MRFISRLAPGAFLDNYFSKDLLRIDAGSSNTRIFSGSRQTFNEPTCVAFHRATGSVVAVGTKAAALLGKAPDSITVSFPVQYGVVAEPSAYELFLKTVMKRLAANVSPLQMVSGQRGSIGCPAGASPVELHVLQTTLETAGLGGIKQMPRSAAAFASLVGKSQPEIGYCVLDLGGQTAEIGIFSAGELVVGKTYKWGGAAFTQVVQDIIRERYSMSISWHTAEQVKAELGQVPIAGSAWGRIKKSAVRGKHLVSQISETQIVTADIFEEEFSLLAQHLVEYLETFFAELPSELVTSALEQGLYLTGGTSQLAGLADYLGTELKCSIHLSDQPFFDVVKGLPTA